MTQQRTPDPGRFRSHRRSGGFTLIELVIVIILIGVLGAIGANRFSDRVTFDAAGYTEQVRSMLRYAQKLAIGQRRPVYVYATEQGMSLCYTASTAAIPCGNAGRVYAPGGRNSESKATKTYCTVSGTFPANWYCEGRPDGLTLKLSTGAGTSTNFYFDGLGRPYQASDTGPDSSFQTLTFTVGGDGLTRTISVSPETGYVY